MPSAASSGPQNELGKTPEEKLCEPPIREGTGGNRRTPRSREALRTGFHANSLAGGGHRGLKIGWTLLIGRSTDTCAQVLAMTRLAHLRIVVNDPDNHGDADEDGNQREQDRVVPIGSPRALHGDRLPLQCVEAP